MEAIASERAKLGKALQVRDSGSGLILRGEQARIGCDNRIARQAALQAQIGHAEIGILVVHMRIARIERRFRNTPWQTARGRIIDLALHHELVGLVKQRTKRLGHDQRRHQIFEHRAGPGEQSALPAHGHQKTAKLEPMFDRNVALGDGEQARQTRFGRQKIVAAFVQFVFLHTETDGEKAAFLPFKETELHIECELARTGSKIAQTLTQRVRIVLADGILGMRLAGIDENARPFHGFSACRGFDFAIEFVHQANDVGCKQRQVDGAEGGRFRLILDGNHGAAEIGNPLFQTAAQRTQNPAIIRDSRDCLFKDVVDIKNTVEVALHVDGWCFRPFFQRRRQRDQMPGKVAAIHRRDIKRAHRRQRVGLVPVVEMALILLHLLKRIDSGLNAVQRFTEADPAEIARGDDGQEIDADIGRRRALRDNRRRIFLEVVRRQMVVFLVCELGEITPGPACIAAQVRLVGRKHFQRVLRLRRTADQPCNQR